jgi:2-polyprenyl-3-methyl-5-hydroxy-6-metoxy-1,4-benzoquinol methylase
VPPYQHLRPVEEKAIYDLHINDTDDPGYRKFLSRLMIPLQERLPSGARGIDYGCGPGPALAAMFAEQGFDMTVYDPIYARNPVELTQNYDFITCTEVTEHFANPSLEFERLFTLLNDHGWLGIMTKLVIDQEAFSQWHYKNDLTHICFFSKLTFQWLAEYYRCHLYFFGNDVILMNRKKQS